MAQPLIISLPNGLLAICETVTDSALLQTLCTDGEVAHSRKFPPARAKEFLSWRALLHQIDPLSEAEYDSNGGPIVKDGNYSHIGVSHTRGFVAAILANTPCSVDIEFLDRNFELTSHRFASPAELALGTGKAAAEESSQRVKNIEDRENFAAPLIWCAKEAMFKLFRQKDIDFKTDMKITSIDLTEGKIEGLFRGVECELSYFEHKNICVVFCLT